MVVRMVPPPDDYACRGVGSGVFRCPPRCFYVETASGCKYHSLHQSSRNAPSPWLGLVARSGPFGSGQWVM